MKTFRHTPLCNGKPGFALVVTLLILSLLTVTVISFFTQTRSDRGMADAYSRGQDTKQLADSTINLVIGQIREATLGFQRDDTSGQINVAKRLGWASQPGMVRTFDNRGRPFQHYKLYSDETMIVTDSNLGDDATDLATWVASGEKAYDALWVDLNAPITKSEGTLVYPVVAPPQFLDGGSGTEIEGGLPVDNTLTEDVQEGIQGFAIHTPPGFDTGDAPSAVNNPAPMPVKWLYVLADGTIASPAGSNADVTVLGATVGNPIVGRIAFWADDETTKVNLNTASEGIFWDQPRANTWMERAVGTSTGSAGVVTPINSDIQPARGLYGYGWAIPMQNEYHRFPGHPATTSLSAVFGDLLPVPGDFINDADEYEAFNQYYKISPYYRDYDGENPNSAGSMGGRQVANYQITDWMTPKSERLYASLDDVYFAPEYSNDERQDQGLSPEDLSTRAFFTTTSSKAPDTTVFGTPRISMWPQMLDKALRNSKDALLAFCSELRPGDGNGNTSVQEYYFQRHSPYLGERDETTRGSSRNPKLDWGILRNQNLYRYLQRMTDLPIPGFGGTLAAKSPNPRSRDQILTQLMDYIRAMTNIAGSQLEPAYSYSAPLDANSMTGGSVGKSITYPTQIPESAPLGGGTRGFARAPMLRSITIVFYATDILKPQDLRGSLSAMASPDSGYDKTLFDIPTNWDDAPPENPFPALSPFGDADLDLDGFEDEWIDVNDNGIEGEIFGELPRADPTDPVKYGFLGERPRIPYTTEIGAAIFVEPVSLTPGSPRIDPHFRFHIKGLETLTAQDRSGTANKFYSYDSNTVRLSGAGSGTGRYPGTGTEIQFTTRDRGPDGGWSNPPKNLPADPDAANENADFVFIGDQYVGTDVKAPNSTSLTSWDQTFRFNGGTLEIEILDASGDIADAEVLQTIEIDFPAATLPVPTLRRAGNGYKLGSASEERRNQDYQVDHDAVRLSAEDRRDADTKIHPFEWDLRFYTNMNSTKLAGESLAGIELDENFPSAPSGRNIDRTVEEEKRTVDITRLDLGGTVEKFPTGTRVYFPDPAVHLAPQDGAKEAFVNPMRFEDRMKQNGLSRIFVTSLWSSDFDSKLFSDFMRSGFIRRGDVVRSIEITSDGTAAGDFRLAAGLASVPATSGIYAPHPQYFDSTVAHAFSARPGGHSQKFGFARAPRKQNGEMNDRAAGGAPEPFEPSLNPPYLEIPGDSRWYSTGAPPSKGGLQGSLVNYETAPHKAATDLIRDSNSDNLVWDSELPFFAAFGQNGAPLGGVGGPPGDWDNAFGWMFDGPWLNFPDQASVYAADHPNYAQAPDRIYYPIDAASGAEAGFSLSPNRQIPSPVMFGSLPSGINPSDPLDSKPWQTLLFSPNPAAGDQHPGFGQGLLKGPDSRAPYTIPPDHLWLDLFTMPVVEPYAISEPFSTAGRINLNYQIMPFQHIDRQTGIYALLKQMRIAAIPTAAGEGGYANLTGSWTHKGIPANGNNSEQFQTKVGSSKSFHEIRYGVDVEETLKGFEKRFDVGDLFRSASEICQIFLVPRPLDFTELIEQRSYHASVAGKSATYDTMAEWWDEDALPARPDSWNGFLTTGDNTREMPYNHIYPRVTTKSNSFRVYFTVQTLKKMAQTDPDTWIENRDRVLSEYRGSALIERYIDPNDPDLPDFANISLDDEEAVIDKYYRFRILETKRFAP